MRPTAHGSSKASATTPGILHAPLSFSTTWLRQLGGLQPLRYITPSPSTQVHSVGCPCGWCGLGQIEFGLWVEIKIYLQIRENTAGIFPVKYGNRQNGQENPWIDSVPDFAGFSRFLSRFPVFPVETVFGRENRYTVLVGTGFSHLIFNPMWL